MVHRKNLVPTPIWHINFLSILFHCKKIIIFFIFSLFPFFISNILYAKVIERIDIYDETGFIKKSFSSVQVLGISVSLSNRYPYPEAEFEYRIFDPRDVLVFRHTGNIAPSPTISSGILGSIIEKIRISDFFTVSGNYRIKIEIKYMNNTVDWEERDIYITMPAITLVSPLNESYNLVPPIRFQWMSIGIDRHKVIVSQTREFENCIFEKTVSDNFLYYDAKELLPERIYYWKVIGYNSIGEKIVESNAIYNFSVKEQMFNITDDEFGIEDVNIISEGLENYVVVKIANKGVSKNTVLNLVLQIKESGYIDVQKINIVPGKDNVYKFKLHGEIIAEKVTVIVTLDNVDSFTKNNRMEKIVSLVKKKIVDIGIKDIIFEKKDGVISIMTIVKNFGDEVVKKCKLNLILEKLVSTDKTISYLLPGEEKTVRFTFTFPENITKVNVITKLLMLDDNNENNVLSKEINIGVPVIPSETDVDTLLKEQIPELKIVLDKFSLKNIEFPSDKSIVDFVNDIKLYGIKTYTLEVIPGIESER